MDQILLDPDVTLGFMVPHEGGFDDVAENWRTRKTPGLTVRTLHHYDHIGLLSPSERSDSGYRLYSQADVIRLHRIQALKQLGFSLSDIRTTMEEPGVSLIEIMSQQMNALDEQFQRARTLRDRLFRLRERISTGEDTGLTDWLTILELMTMYERHFSKDELDTLRSNKASRDLGGEWSRLAAQVRDFMGRGVSPESKEVQELAWRWIRLLRDTTGNDAGLAMKLKRMHREEQNAQLLSGITPEMIEYITRAFSKARDAVLEKYLAPGELEMVRGRRAAYASEWLPLIAEIRQEIERGTAPNDPAVQALARRWESLFRESYWGEDLELAAKIRSAFRNEPDLLLGVGIDPPLIAFVQRAIRHVQPAQGSEGDHADAVPKPSALRVATLRAAHQLLDAPLVFEDPFAFRLLSEPEEESLRRDPSAHNTPLLRGLRTSLVVRSRLAEDEWTKSKQSGLRQVVILGAGLDTFAYRNEGSEELRIFEVDLPETQQWKRDRLRAAGIPEPESLTFVPIDFERSTLAEALGRAAFSYDAPAFFSWLGVTMYLEEEAVMDTLRFVASLAPGSCVVFDYAVLPSLLSPRERKVMESLASKASERGEPWKTRFDPVVLAGRLRLLGFSHVEDFGPEELNDRYLSGRKDGLRKSGVSRLVCARV